MWRGVAWISLLWPTNALLHKTCGQERSRLELWAGLGRMAVWDLAVRSAWATVVDGLHDLAWGGELSGELL